MTAGRRGGPRGGVASFDKAIDRLATVERIEPPGPSA
jgi:hypothetical protein